MLSNIQERQTPLTHSMLQVLSLPTQIQITTHTGRFTFKAEGGALKKQYGIHQPDMYSAAMSVGGGSKVA